MKKSVSKIIALSLCAALTAGMAGCAAPAAVQEEDCTAPAAVNRLAASDGTAAVPYKDETVYVLAGADGSVEKIIVSDWLKNPTGSAYLRDATDLTDVENVKGTETFAQEDGALVWDAQGGDIYCQGSTRQDLPVEMSVTYTLDGRSISPEELAGKSGRVTIRFDYTNNEYEMTDINGKQEKIYVPFAMLTGLALDNRTFRNVEVSSGRVYSDGNRTIVAGLAFPGLQENLALDPEKLEIPSYVEVTADVQNFRLANTVTIAVSDLFAGIDTGELDSADSLEDALADMTDAMEQLMDGSSRLYDGLCQLLDKSGVLADAIRQLAMGTQALQAGAADLQSGLEALSANNGQLVGGAKQVFDTLLASAAGQLRAAGLELPELTAENYAAVLDAVIAQLPEEAAAPVAAAKASLDSYNAFYQGLVSYTGGVSQAAGGAAQLTGGIAQVSDGAAQLEANAPALIDGVTQLRDGALALDNGLREFNQRGIQKLADAVDGDLSGLTARLRATVEAAKGYETFSGGEGQVKFVYRTEAVGLEK